MLLDRPYQDSRLRIYSVGLSIFLRFVSSELTLWKYIEVPLSSSERKLHGRRLLVITVNEVNEVLPDTLAITEMHLTSLHRVR